MNTNINTLLEKYWNAETSLQEEAELRSYFSSNDVDNSHKQYKDLFSYLSEKRFETTDLDVDKVLSKLDETNVLCEKYWNAETSLEEETELKEYFALHDTSVDHPEMAGIFGYFSEQRKMESSLDVEKILRNLDQENPNTHRVSTISGGGSSAKIINLRKWAIGIAAIFVLGLSAVSVMNPSTTETQYKGKFVQLDEEAEAQEAYEITKQALAFLSKNIKTGSKTVVESVSKAEKASIFK